jgi:type I restriction enzyme S subunit
MLLKDCIEIKNGKDYSDLSDGNIPVYGTGGIFKYVDKYIYDGSALLLPRKGSLNNVMYTENKKFWTVDTMFYAISKNECVNLKYLYYYLTLLDIARMDVGSTVPSMTTSLYYQIDVPFPDRKTQDKIAEILSGIDEQINRNNEIVKKLQVLAQTTYSRWFNQFEFPNEDGLPYKSISSLTMYLIWLSAI